MTLSGVEQIVANKKAPPARVNPTMTPSGVEQTSRLGRLPPPARVNPTMTPSGVEQGSRTVYQLPRGREPDDDAFGR